MHITHNFWNINFDKPENEMSEFWTVFEQDGVFEDNNFVLTNVVQYGHLNILKAILAQPGFTLTAESQRIIYTACWFDRTNIVEFLLQNHYITDEPCLQPSFKHVCTILNLPLISIFLDNDFDPSFDNNSCLSLAYHKKDEAIISLLCDNKYVLVNSFANDGKFHTKSQIDKLSKKHPELFL